MTKTLKAGAAIAALVAGGASAQSLEFPVGEGAFTWASFEDFAANHDYSGASLELTGPWVGADADLVNSVIAYFEEATGASASYSGSDSFEQDIVIAIQAGSAPNIAIFPQPGLAQDMAARGALTALGDDTRQWILDSYAAGQSWVDLATFQGPEGNENLYGLFYKVDVKSLVWYVPANFEELGYEVPQTLEALKELTQQIVDDGGTPWCVGLGAGAGTGWPATDWVEDMMLRVNDPSVYDQWVSHEIPFDDPQVVSAIEEYGWFVRNDDFVDGGSEAAATTDFRTSPRGLFGFPPDCLMHKAPTFIPTFFPEGTVLGEDADFFYFPAYEQEDLGQPVLGAGTMFTITNDSDVATGFMEFLQTPIAHEIWMAQSGFLTPFTEVNTEVFPSDVQRELNAILTDATTFRFDASDLMPGEIGAGAFWSGMVDYTTGAPAEEVAAQIERRWQDIQ